MIVIMIVDFKLMMLDINNVKLKLDLLKEW